MQHPERAGKSPVYVTPIQRAMALLSAGAVAWVLVTIFEATRVTEVAPGTWAGLAGVVAPVVMLATTGVGLVAWCLEPRAPWGLARLRNELASDAGLGRRLAFVLAFTCWSTLVALVVLGAVGLAGLGLEGGWQSGAGVSSMAVVSLGVGLSMAAVWATRHFAARTSTGVSLGLAGGAVVVMLLLVVLGETSGAGGIGGMWGVFRREELDLTLPCYGLLIVVLGYQVSWHLAAFPRWVGAGGAVLAIAAFVWSARMAPDIALQIEREAPLAGSVLKGYQKRLDADGDGFAGLFGGGDCDDDAADLNPDAVDVAGNGLDEDCSGKDAQVASSPSVDKPVPNPAGAPAATTTEPATTKPVATDFNVVMITVDTLRYDLGFTGYHRPISPNIDALAKRSTVYDKAYSLASYTSKSLAPMLIGRYGSETNRGWMHFNKYPTEDRMVQERLKAHGVYTMSVQGHWYFKEDTGLGRGFDVLDLSAAPTRPQGEGDKTVNSAQLSDAAIGLLQKHERAEKRFFMWVHYLDPHAEYVAHPEFDFGSKGRERYDGEIAFTDFHIGRVLQAIEASPLAQRTIIVLTSDHGEAFGEHGLIRHGFELWEELVRVPLLVHVPGQAPRHIAQRRSAIDLVPTLLDVYGVPTPSGADALSGQSLLAEWLGDAPQARDVFIDMPAGPYNGDRQAFISNDVKVITSNSRPVGLYNLATDPGETSNLIKDAALSEQSLERMKAFRSKLRVVKVKPL